MKRSDFLKRLLGAVIVVPILPAIIEKATQENVHPLIDYTNHIKKHFPNGKGCTWDPHGKMPEIKLSKTIVYNDENKELGNIWDECWEKLLEHDPPSIESIGHTIEVMRKDAMRQLLESGNIKHKIVKS